MRIHYQPSNLYSSCTDKGDAIFTSQFSVVETLEERTHLAATPLSAYYPMVRSSSWVYSVNDNGRHKIRTDTIIGRLTRVHGQGAFTQVHKWSDGIQNYDLENYSRTGQIQWHRLGDFSFTPAMILPRLAKAGQHTHEEGATIAATTFRPTGQYKMDFTVLGTGQVRVPAGTFSCLKIRFDLDLALEHHSAQDDISIHVAATQTAWWAKGIGLVKAVATAQGEATINGDHQVTQSAQTTTLKSYHIAQAR